jgi:hypothetical protein
MAPRAAIAPAASAHAVGCLSDELEVPCHPPSVDRYHRRQDHAVADRDLK